jgi:hypothetical protein
MVASPKWWEFGVDFEVDDTGDRINILAVGLRLWKKP